MDYQSYDSQKAEELAEYLHFFHTNQKNYLVVQFDEEERYFETGMILYNALPHLLPVSFRQQKDCYELYYEISNRQSLEAIHRLRPYRFPELADYLNCLGTLLDVLDDYLLNADDLVLREEYLFVSYEGNRCDFLYLPGYGIPFRKQMKDLNDMVMRRLDHLDQRATRLIYELDRLFCLDHWNFDELHRILDPLNREAKEERDLNEAPEDGNTASVTGNIASVTGNIGGGLPAVQSTSEGIAIPGTPGKKHDKRTEKPAERSGGKGTKEKGTIASGSSSREPNWLQKLTGIGRQELVCDRTDSDEGVYQTEPAVKDADGSKQMRSMSMGSGQSVTPFIGNSEMENTGLLQEEPFQTPVLLPLDPERRRIPIDRDQVVIGSMKDRTDFYLPDSHISRMHLRIFSENDSWYIMDQNSTNGTFLNEERLIPYEKYELKDLARVRIADRDYTFRIG